MASIDLLIAKLDQKLRSLYQEQSLSIQIGGTITKQGSLLSEYINLTSIEGVVPAIEYIALDGLARHFNLYEDDRQRSQILAAMADELQLSTDSEILASIQVIQYAHPLIYEVSKEKMSLTQERAIGKMTGLSIALPKPSTGQPTELSQESISTTPDLSDSPRKSHKPVIIAIATSSFFAAILGVLIANNFNKFSTKVVANNSNQLNAVAIDRNNISIDPSPKTSTEKTDTSASNSKNISPNTISGGEQSITISDDSNTSLEPSSTTNEQKDKSKDDSTTYPQELSPQSTTSRPSPAQAIRDHYQALNNREYELTWNNLSPKFQAESGKSLALSRREYENWWNSVSSIDLQQADTLQINDDGSKAIVNYHVSYTMNNGKTIQDKHKRIFLIWDNEKGKWLIDRRG